MWHETISSPFGQQMKTYHQKVQSDNKSAVLPVFVYFIAVSIWNWHVRAAKVEPPYPAFLLEAKGILTLSPSVLDRQKGGGVVEKDGRPELPRRDQSISQWTSLHGVLTQSWEDGGCTAVWMDETTRHKVIFKRIVLSALFYNLQMPPRSKINK